jgi:glycerate dehydrogenase
MIVRAFYRMRDFRIVQQVWGLILSLTQHASDYARMAADGSWAQNEVLTAKSRPIRELDGRIFGVVGWGELGRGRRRSRVV